MNKPLLKVYGERNTGTNYMSQLIRLNLDVTEVPGVVPKAILHLQGVFPGKEFIRDIYFLLSYRNNLGWKHSLVKPINLLRQYKITNYNLSFITLTKNPYSWLLSLYNSPYHQYYDKKPDLLQFLNSPWKTLRRENTARIIKSPIELWNIKNNSYLQLSKIFRVLHITYETILKEPAAVIGLISTTFFISKKSIQFCNYDRSTKEDKKDSNYYKDYYLNEKWKDKLSKKVISIINEALDKNLMKYFGYSYLPPLPIKLRQ